MECDYAPNNWQEDHANDTNLPISNLDGFYAEGYDIQMPKLIAEDLGVEIEIVKLAWSGLIQALKEGQIDMIIAGTYYIYLETYMITAVIYLILTIALQAIMNIFAKKMDLAVQHGVPSSN